MAYSNRRSRISIDVSIIILGWNQSKIIHHTVKSAERSAIQARSKGLNCEIIIALSKVTGTLGDYLDRLVAESEVVIKIIRTGPASEGQIVNSAISKAIGEYLTIIRSGDMMSGNWILEGTSVLKHAKQAIIHPKYLFGYGQIDRLQEFSNSTDKYFIPESMVEFDSFPDIMMTTTKIAKNNPFADSAEYCWVWNAVTLSKSINHLVAPNTLYAKRFINNANPESRSILPILNLLQPTGKQHTIKSQIDTEPVQGKINGLLRAATSMLEKLYESPMSKLARKNSRADTYLTGLLNETRHLLRPLTRKEIKIPDWVTTELYELHKIDLGVFPTEYLRRNIEIFKPRSSGFTSAYWNMAESIGNQTDILFLVPYLKNGGAELEIANLTNTVLELRPKMIIKMLTTEPSGSPGVSVINKRIDIIEANSDFYSLALDQQARLLATLIVQLAPKKIHLVNSVAGYIALQNFSDVIAETAKIFITIFMIDRTPEARDTHKFTECMTDAIEHVQMVYTDNQAVIDRLVELMGVSREKFRAIYQPANLNNLNTDERFTSKPFKILWAGRLDRQKRPDILAEIVKKANGLKGQVEFYAFGSAELADFNYRQIFNEVPELHYRGPYEKGLQSLDLTAYDIFMMTSEWEGYPNALLEAIAGGLLPIAPRVGGVPELIVDGKTGYLVKQFDDVGAYLNAIKKAIDAGQSANQLIKQAQAVIQRRHNLEDFQKIIKLQKEYLD